jgi:hypothetical protein
MPVFAEKFGFSLVATTPSIELTSLDSMGYTRAIIKKLVL